LEIKKLDQSNGRFGYNQFVTATGILTETNILNDDKIRLVTENAGGTNEIKVYAKLNGQTNWDLLKTITGVSDLVVKVDTYERIKIESTILDGTNVKLIGAGFYNEC
jgi:hypothetical protein